jgi:outer membrane murein-binding lipoprotein Lpp
VKSLPLASVALSLAVVAGCASGPPPQTTADVARANTLVAAAEQGGAQQYAAADLQAAHDEAQQANQLANSDPARADELANEAAVDAKLANARAQNAQAHHGLKQLRQTLDTLRNEEQRKMDQPPSPNDTPENAAPQNEPPQGPPPQGTAPLNQGPPPGEDAPPPQGSTPPGPAGSGNK